MWREAAALLMCGRHPARTRLQSAPAWAAAAAPLTGTVSVKAVKHILTATGHPTQQLFAVIIIAYLSIWGPKMLRLSRSGPCAAPQPRCRSGISCNVPSRTLHVMRTRQCSSSYSGPEPEASTSEGPGIAMQAQHASYPAAKALVDRMRTCAYGLGQWMREQRLQQLVFGCAPLCVRRRRRLHLAGICRTVHPVALRAVAEAGGGTHAAPYSRAGQSPRQHVLRPRPHRGDAGALGLGPHPLQLMAAAMVLPTLPGGGVNDLFTNRVFLAGFWAWFTAQTLKVSRREGRLWEGRQPGCLRNTTIHHGSPPWASLRGTVAAHLKPVPLLMRRYSPSG